MPERYTKTRTRTRKRMRNLKTTFRRKSGKRIYRGGVTDEMYDKMLTAYKIILGIKKILTLLETTNNLSGIPERPLQYKPAIKLQQDIIDSNKFIANIIGNYVTQLKKFLEYEQTLLRECSVKNDTDTRCNYLKLEFLDEILKAVQIVLTGRY